MNYKILLGLLVLLLLSASSVFALNSFDAISYYTFTSDTSDSLGVNDFTNSGGVATVNGIISGAYDFESGSGQYMSKTGFAAFPSDFSINLWIKRESSGVANFILDHAGTDRSTFLVNSNDNLAFEVIGPSTRPTAISDITINSGDWNMVTFVYDGSSDTAKLYINGTETTYSFQQAGSGGPSGSGTFWFGRNNPGTNYFDGIMDELGIFNKKLNTTEISYLYALGVPGEPQQYPFTPSSIGNYTLTVVDEWSGSAVNNVTVTILGETYTNTTGNIVYTNISANESLLWDLNVTGEDYFSKSFTNKNLSDSSSLDLYQSQINFSAFELYTNNSLDNVTFTVGSQSNGTFPLKVGSYVVTATKNNYYLLNQSFNVSALDNLTIDVTGLYNSIVNVSLFDIFSGGKEIAFSINVDSSIYSDSLNTSSSYVLFNFLEGYNLTVNLTSSDYISVNETYLVNASYYNITLFSYKSVNVNFNFFDEQTLLPLNDVDFDLLGSIFSNNFSTGSGNDYYVTGLPEAIYEIRYIAANYTARSYYVSIPHIDVGFANISLYLVEETDSQLFLRTITDQGNNPLIGYYLEVQRPYPSDDNTSLIYRTVEIASIDNQGDAVFTAIPNMQQYRFRVLNSLLQLTNTLTPSFLVDTSSSIIAQESGNPMDDFNTATDTVGVVYYQNTSSSFIFDYTAPVTVIRVCLEVVNNTGFTSTTQTVCSESNSGTIAIIIETNTTSNYFATGYVYPSALVKIPVDDDGKDFSFAGSRETVRYIGAFLYFITLMMCATIGGFKQPVPAIFLALGATAAFSISFLGLFTFSTYLVGGLLVISIVVLLMLRESDN